MTMGERSPRVKAVMPPFDGGGPSDLTFPQRSELALDVFRTAANRAGSFAVDRSQTLGTGQEARRISRGFMNLDRIAHPDNFLPPAEADIAWLDNFVTRQKERLAGTPGVDLEDISPETWKTAHAVRRAMVLGIKDFGSLLQPEDVNVVLTVDPDTQKPVVHVMDTSPDGSLYKKYGDLWPAPSAYFNIEMGGQIIDTMGNMTTELYEAFIANARLRGQEPLPDIPGFEPKRGEFKERHFLNPTILTGELSKGKVEEMKSHYDLWDIKPGEDPTLPVGYTNPEGNSVVASLSVFDKPYGGYSLDHHLRAAVRIG